MKKPTVTPKPEKKSETPEPVIKGEIKNAQITDTMLGFEDHGIFTYMIYLNYGGAAQGFGGYVLSGEYAPETIKRILKVIGLQKWEDMKGRVCRAEVTQSKVLRIGHYLEDKWFTPEELSKELGLI